MSTLNITARQFADLVNPVLPLAEKDGMIPVLNAVLIETDGKWLSATATDRFRVGIKRIEKIATDDDLAAEWPEFRALIPLRAVRALLATFRPRRNSTIASLAMSVEDDGRKLVTEGVGTFDLFDSSRVTHYLEIGEYPGVRSIIRGALASTPEGRVTEFAVNPFFMADFKACGSRGLRILAGVARENGKPGPLVVTDDEGFIGALMPTNVLSDRREDWTDFIAAKPKPQEKTVVKKAAPRKRAPKKGAAA